MSELSQPCPFKMSWTTDPCVLPVGHKGRHMNSVQKRLYDEEAQRQPQPPQPEAPELLPCPLTHPVINGVKFASFSKSYSDDWHAYAIWCFDCGLQFQGNKSQDAKATAEHWNRRADLAAERPADEDERVKEIRERRQRIDDWVRPWPDYSGVEDALYQHAMRWKEESTWMGRTRPSAEFISHAPTDIDYLLSLLDRQRVVRSEHVGES